MDADAFALQTKIVAEENAKLIALANTVAIEKAKLTKLRNEATKEVKAAEKASAAHEAETLRLSRLVDTQRTLRMADAQNKKRIQEAIESQYGAPRYGYVSDLENGEVKRNERNKGEWVPRQYDPTY